MKDEVLRISLDAFRTAMSYRFFNWLTHNRESELTLVTGQDYVQD